MVDQLKKILLIEDNNGDARLIQGHLKDIYSLGEIIHVNTLENGFEVLEGGDIDAIILDLEVPDSHGVEGVDRIRAKYFDLPIIVLTGLMDDESGLEAIKSGAEDYLVKDDITAKSLYKSINFAIERSILKNQNRELLEKAKFQNNQLQALRDIDLAIIGSLDLNLILNLIINQGMHLLNVDAIGILLSMASSHLKYISSRGIKTHELDNLILEIGSGISGVAALEKKPIIIQDISKYDEYRGFLDILIKEGFVSFLAYPLITKGELVGVIEIYNESGLDPSPDWWAFLESLAGQSAIAIHNAKLFEKEKKAQSELFVAYEETLEGWAKALELRDSDTQGHTLGVTNLTLDLAQYFNFSDEKLTSIRRGAILHDIGMLSIPDSILHKPGKLNEDEWKIMRRHPQIAKDLLQPIEYLKEAMIIPYFHHEKWDGNGYPQGIKGKLIPVEARIFSIVDVWNALNSDRSYRKAWPREKCVDYMREQSGTHFDPEILNVFMREMVEK